MRPPEGRAHTRNPASQKRTVFTPRNFSSPPPPFGGLPKKLLTDETRSVLSVRWFLEGESYRFTPKKLRIQLKIQSVRLKRKLDAGFIA
jgi:hypothetical protein